MYMNVNLRTESDEHIMINNRTHVRMAVIRDVTGGNG